MTAGVRSGSTRQVWRDGLRQWRLPRSYREWEDRLFASSSLVSNAPVLDVRDFPWTQGLRDAWHAIRDETGAADPCRRGPAPGSRVQAVPPGWSRTRAVLATIPDVEDVALSILPPGAHRQGLGRRTKRLITCHLGLVVPRTGDVRLRVGDRVVRWAEGETLVFDETHGCQVSNDTDDHCVVLAVRFARPLRHPGRWLADRIGRLARSPAA